MISLIALVLALLWLIVMLYLAILFFEGLKYCTACVYNRVSCGRVRLVDEEETRSYTPTLFERDIIHSSYQNNSIRNNVNQHTSNPIYVHHPLYKKAPPDRKQHQQLIIKKIPTQTQKQEPYYPFGGSPPQAFKKCLIVTELKNKSTLNHFTESTKGPLSPPHKVAPSHVMITLQTSSRCINCNQIFSETNPLLRVSKDNNLQCVGCRR